MGTITINRRLRLTDDQYFKEETEKTQIVLHHTVGGSARSTFNWWQSNPDRIATAYLIERDGTIYEVFDPLYWAHHLGLRHPRNVVYNRASIGIELASEGALRSGEELNTMMNGLKFDPKYLYAYDIYKPPFDRAKKLYHISDDTDKYFDMLDLGLNAFRGYRWFDKYDEPQVVATIELVHHLCEMFSIPKVASDTFEFSETWMEYVGVITHVNVRKDKSDLCPNWSWQRLFPSNFPKKNA